MGMGQLYKIIETHMDQSGYRVSARQVADRLGVSPSTVGNWRSPKELIEKRHLVAIARVTHVPYQRVLDALLDDIGYLHEADEPVNNTAGDGVSPDVASGMAAYRRGQESVAPSPGPKQNDGTDSA